MTSPARGRRTAVFGLVACAALALGACTSTDSPPGAQTATSTTTDVAGAQVTRLLQDGIAYAQSGKYDQATTTFANVLSVDPSNKFALYNLGLIAQTQKNDKSAVDYYDKALQSDPGYQPAMYNKAIVLEASDVDQATALYEKITQANPQASTAWFRLSICYQQKGRVDDAKAARDKAIALDPTLADAPTGTAPPPATSPSATATSSSTTTRP